VGAGAAGGSEILKLLAIFWTAFLIGLSGALVPGPVLTVTIKEAGRRGAKAGPLITLGHGIAEVAITIALVAGLSAFINNTTLRMVVAVAGGAVLCYMGVSMVRSLKTIELDLRAAAEGREEGAGVSLRPVLLGISATVSNPYWFGWWGSIGAGLIVASSAAGLKGIIAFVTGHVLSDLVWYSVVSYLVSLGLSHGRGRWYKVLFAVCGAFLIFVGALFVRYGFTIRQS
jgi:threonine/homoserine/homoserine lactone efflux protein